MIKEAYSGRDVDGLVQRLRDDDLLAEDQEAIRDIIRNHPKARRRLARVLAVDAQLKEALEVSLAGGELSLGERAWWRGWPVVLLILALLGGIIAVAVSGKDGVDIDPAASEENLEDVKVTESLLLEVNGVAVVSRQEGAVWHTETEDVLRTKEGRSILGAGVLHVESGVLQVDFYSGATVLIEGPAKFELLGAAKGRLFSGKVMADVPTAASDFKIESSEYESIEFGRRFALNVRPSGEREIHVFDGKVQVNGVGDAATIVENGQAVFLSPKGETLRNMKAQPNKFLSAESLDEKVKSQRERWAQVGDLLRSDPDVLVYYTFDKERNWGRTIQNMARDAGDVGHGAIVGCRPVEGRWLGKEALGFENSSNRLRLEVPGEHEALTLAAWVKVNEFHSPYISLVNPETEQDRFLHWSITSDGDLWKKDPQHWHMHFAESVSALGQEGRQHYHSMVNVEPLLSDKKWAHLAVVYDPEKMEVRHYGNGQRIFTNEIVGRRPLSVGVADIGNWPYKHWAEGTRYEVRYLNGAIDEFLIAKRAFSDGELKQLYEDGKP